MLDAANRCTLDLCPIYTFVEFFIHEADRADIVAADEVESESYFAGLFIVVGRPDQALHGVIENLNMRQLRPGLVIQLDDLLRTRFVLLSAAASVPTRIRESAVTMRTFSDGRRVSDDDTLWTLGLTVEVSSKCCHDH